jgi:CheY-like chemotaxis protein
MSTDSKPFVDRFATAKILLMDDEQYMRKVVRTMLMGIGMRELYEAADGQAASRIEPQPAARRRHPRLSNARA